MKRIIPLLCVLGAHCGESIAADTRPNVILIYTDDHGYSDLGIHGLKSDLKTPQLDALARSGVVAKNGYSTAPQCVPSRGGLLTGHFQGRFGLDINHSAPDGFNQQNPIAGIRFFNPSILSPPLGPGWRGFGHCRDARRPGGSGDSLRDRTREAGPVRRGTYRQATPGRG